MICSPDYLAQMEEKYCSNLVPPDAKNSFRDPTQTYLESPWTLWLVNKSGAQNKTWLECIHPIATFSTIQQFWGMYNTLKPPSELPSHWEYALFRGGIGRRVIVPDWDDSENSGGGCMQLTGFSLEPKTIDHLWRDICLKAIEEAWIHTSDYINGTIVSTKAGTTRFYVWIAPCKEHIWDSVRDRIESVFAQDCRTPLKWTPHMERKSPTTDMALVKSVLSGVKVRASRKARAGGVTPVVDPQVVPRSFRSRSVGYRAQLDADVRTDQYLLAKRTAQKVDAAKDTESGATKRMYPYMQSVKGSASMHMLRSGTAGMQGNQSPYVGHRRGRSCHGLKAHLEYPVFNSYAPRDHSRCQGSGDVNTVGCKVCFLAQQPKRLSRAPAMVVKAGKGKEMVDVSTQFNAKITNMAGGDSGDQALPAEPQTGK